MRIKKYLVILLLAAMMLTGCESLFSPAALSSDASVRSNGLTFYAYSYASPNPNAKIDKAEKILVIMNNYDFRWQRAVETNVKDALIEQGFDVVILSDILPTSIENLSYSQFWDTAYEQEAAYVMLITIENSYTYEKGGGVAEVEFAIDIESTSTFDTLLHMIINTDSASNELASYAQGIGPASECLAKAITKEYVQYSM